MAQRVRIREAALFKLMLDQFEALIDYLNGIQQAWAELEHYEHASISVVTWIEVMAGTALNNVQITRSFLMKFEILPISMAVAGRAATIRHRERLKLPDAIILAAAEIGNHILVTRNTRDFDAGDVRIRVPYQL